MKRKGKLAYERSITLPRKHVGIGANSLGTARSWLDPFWRFSRKEIEMPKLCSVACYHWFLLLLSERRCERH